MSKNDVKRPKTIEELMRKYDFPGILGLKKNVEVYKKTLFKVENELNNMLNSFIINLANVIESQSEVSLWFYDYVPTTSNVPYTSWNNKQEHDGDLFYNQATGRVYQFDYSNSAWVENTDEGLVLAMATTNSGIDTSSDHERKIYFEQPTPPYDSGDWWIKADGVLFICQLTKASGSYETSDFINSANYVANVAVKNNNEITVLKGTVMLISENYVSIEDLETGGRTIINGSNITTGTIDASKVMVDNLNANNIKSGKIDAKVISIENDNVVFDKDGIKLNNGAKIIGNNGLMNTYLYEQEGFAGFIANYTSGSLQFKKNNILIDVVIPSGLVITKAKVRLIHNPVKWNWYNPDNGQSGVNWGYARGMKLYKCTNVSSKLLAADFGGQVYSDADVSSYSEITGAFGNNGFTANAASDSSHNAQSVLSSDIKSHLSAGLNQLKIETSEAIPTAYNVACQKSAHLEVQVEIEGYMSYT